MKGDFTRDTFQSSKHYNSVRMQQGRVPLDADWNENESISSYLSRTQTIDVLGGCGTPVDRMPANGTGFEITSAAAKFKIGSGHYYVDGILCENDAQVDFEQQPDLPSQTAPTTGSHFFYLDVWEEHVTALEDPSIREVALNGPDTATRLRTVWQVKRRDITALPSKTCAAAFADIPGPTTATLKARAKTLDDTEACTVKPGSSYKRLENQLYRLEVHAAGASAAQAKFKWSRDNATVVSKFQITNPKLLTVDSTGRDQMFSFASGQFVEITDRKREMLGQAGDFFKIARVDGNTLTLETAVTSTNYDINTMKVRRWDSQGAISYVPTADGYMFLEDGIQVQLAGANFQVGDYWLIPARTVTGDIDWPKSGTDPVTKAPHGIKHHYCPLAIATKNGDNWDLTDCRNFFVPLTKGVTMYYLAGDGQTATPNPLDPGATLDLPTDPMVGISRNQLPLAGYAVRFSLLSGGGTINGGTAPVVVTSLPNGTASVDWRLSSTIGTQQLLAELLIDGGPSTTHLPITFTATLNVADKVAYTPTNCPNLAGKITVQQALDELCKQGSRTCCKSIGDGGDYPTIREALSDLVAKKAIGACLCFLPGNHLWPPDLQANGNDLLNLTLTGVHDASLVSCDGDIRFGAFPSLTITDLSLQTSKRIIFGGVQDLSIRCTNLTATADIAFVQCADASIHESNISCTGRVRFGGNARLSVTGCNIDVRAVGDAIAVAQCESVLIESCTIHTVLAAEKPGAGIRFSGVNDLVVENNTIRTEIPKKEGSRPFGIFAIQEDVGTLLNLAGTGAPQLGDFAKKLASQDLPSRQRQATRLLEGMGSYGITLTQELSIPLLLTSSVLSQEAAAPDELIKLATQLAEIFKKPIGAFGLPLALISFGVALLLQDGTGSMRISSNLIQGYVGLYGDPEDARMTSATAMQISARMKNHPPNWGRGALHFESNDLLGFQLTREMTNPAGSMLKELLGPGTLAANIFRNMTIANNSFVEMPLEILGQAVTFTSNGLNASTSEFAGTIIAHRATSVGNIAHGGMVLIMAVEQTLLNSGAMNIGLSFQS